MSWPSAVAVVRAKCTVLLFLLTHSRWLQLQSDTAREVLEGQLVGRETSVACFLEWRKVEASIAHVQSALWLPSPAHFSSNDPAQAAHQGSGQLHAFTVLPDTVVLALLIVYFMWTPCLLILGVAI